MIKLTELLRFDNLSNVKIRLVPQNRYFDPVELVQSGKVEQLMEAMYWNYKKRSFRAGQIAVGFMRLQRDNQWLLFHVGKVVRELDRYDAIGYEYDELPEYKRFVGRLVVRFKNRSQNMVRRADTLVHDMTIDAILPDGYDLDEFPGYDKVNISWERLVKAIDKDSWATALGNQKGVYLITDKASGKMYVGSAYGDEMILGRWKSYANSCHGGNVELRKIETDYIKENFEYTILEIFKSSTDDETILNRESFWKRVLHTRDFGYNLN